MNYTRATWTVRAGLLCAALITASLALSAPAHARTATRDALPELPTTTTAQTLPDDDPSAEMTREPQALDGLRVLLLTITGQPVSPELLGPDDDLDALDGDDDDVLADVREALGLDDVEAGDHDHEDDSIWGRSLSWLADWLGVEIPHEVPASTLGLTILQAQLAQQWQALTSPQPRRVPVRISSHFGKRYHPVLKRWKLHKGTDFAAPTGTPVIAVADGEVRLAGYYGAAGNYILIKHENGYASQYMHLSRISRGLKRGQRVRRGQLIGRVGTTGRSTGPHLHFGLKRQGVSVDPLKVHDFAYTAPIREMEQEVAFRTRVKPLLARLDPELIRRANPETR